MTDPTGDTAHLLRRAGVRTIAALDSPDEIAVALRRFLDRLRRGDAELPDETSVRNASRLHRARELADLLDRLPEVTTRVTRDHRCSVLVFPRVGDERRWNSARSITAASLEYLTPTF